MKKILFTFLLFLFVCLGSLNIVWASELPQDTVSVVDTKNINTENNSDIKKNIIDIYGIDNADKIYDRVMEIASDSIEERPTSLKEEDSKRASDWYKDEIIYMFYVDQFGVKAPDMPNTFKDSMKMFDYLEDLGVTTLYMLPFADSPMKDAGFDVKNPQNVRRDLGGTTEFKEFVATAKKRGFKIKADLVLNHFSREHEWFKALEQGDLSKLDYFVATDEMPEYKRYKDDKLGVVVEYKEKNGKISKRRLIFPEATEHNYRKINVKDKDYYLYHTFYPFQLDINWNNPEVLYYSLQTISYWSNMGIDIFRMDAVPYLSKEAGTNAENLPKTHSIIKLLSNYIQLTAPSTVIQVEACQTPEKILPYFGKERNVDINTNEEKKEILRTDEAQIAYHFPYMPAIWASLLTEDKKYFIEAYKKTPKIPESCAWAIFLRVHDELTLEMTNKEIRELIYNSLSGKGAGFREGFGVSGRMANFLDKDPDRIKLAYSILLSQQGIPIIYYGDEVGVSNNFENAKKLAEKRESKTSINKFKLLNYFDSRDIHRGEVPAKLFYGSSKDYYSFNSRIYKKVKNLIHLRKSLPVMSKGEFILLNTKSPHSFSYIRKDKNKQILVIHNLSKENLAAEVNIPLNIVLREAGRLTSLENLINNNQVNVSIKNRIMYLKMDSYETLWLEL